MITLLCPLIVTILFAFLVGVLVVLVALLRRQHDLEQELDQAKRYEAELIEALRAQRAGETTSPKLRGGS
ncbi:hypothetical protein [Opitutus terrae]|uniref:Uncharacterized protein n=1 Tax=Opitutus terrae (strain DSM 11246 / JCM 15787 / PB90-1) TaxID=452637 RepID=B1ZUA8_OPITP|nr:hypothetical protein [Opitutus terrae]ACB76670.1 hypothetical protein Oter_3393 [Opitutus terrae PB90-1]